MAAATYDRNTDYSLGDLLAIPVAAGERIFAGTLVNANLAGYAKPAEDIAGEVFEGVATKQADNRLGGDGDADVVVRRNGRFRFAADGFVDQSAQGGCCYVADDQTVEVDANKVTGDVLCGMIDRIVSPHDVWVAIMPNCRTWVTPTTTTCAPHTTTTAP